MSSTLLPGIFSKTMECVTDFFVDFIKDRCTERIDKQELKKQLQQYAEKNSEPFYKGLEETNIDLEGLLAYVKDQCSDEIQRCLFIIDPEESARIKKEILTKARSYSRANAETDKEIVNRLIENILDISRHFYIDKFEPSQKLQTQIIMEHANKNTDKIIHVVNTVQQFQNISIGKMLTKAPPRVDDNFLYRDNTVKEVIKKIEEENNLLLVNGLGGVGKTAVARAVFHKVKDHFEHLGWIEYEGNLKNSVLSSFRIYEEAGEERFSSIMNFLRNATEDTLLFIDDVTKDTAEDSLLSEFAGLGVKIVLTSRITGMNYYKGFEINFLSPNECIDMFYQYYGFDKERKYQETVEKIVEMVSCHTLSVELVAKSVPGGKNLEEYDKQLKELGFGFPNIEVNTAHTEQMKTIAEHLKILFDLTPLDEESKRILRNFALMPSIDIPSEVTKWINCSENDLRKLSKLGWLTETENGYLMHSIVIETIKLDPIPDGTATSFLKYIEDNKYVERTELYSVVRKKLSISESILSQINVSETEEFANIYNNLALVYKAQGKYEEALSLYKDALQIREEVLGKDHPDTAASYNNLAGVYQAQGKYGEALSLYKDALQICEEVLGKNHPSTATSYNNLASVYQAQGKYEEALPLLVKALQIREEVLGKNHPSTATSFANLAMVYQSQGKYEEALPLLEKALQIREKVLGKNHPDTATSYNNLARVYHSQGKYEEALPLLVKALQIREEVLGKNHPSTATSYNNLAWVYKDQGKYEEALPLYKDALQIREEVLGKNHPSTATSYNNLAMVYHDLGKYEEALPLYKDALQISEKVFGKNHPDTAASYNNLAWVYKAQGKYEEALQLYVMAYRIYKDRFGIDHPNSKIIYKNLRICFKQAKLKKSFSTWLNNQL